MKKFSPGIFLVTLVILLRLASADASGQSPRADTSKKGDIKDLTTLVTANKKAANGWWYGWIAGYGTATVVQGGIALTSGKLGTRQDMWNGAATTFLGVAGCLLTPLVPTEEQVRKKLLNDKGRSAVITDRDLEEAMLAEMASRENFGRSWKVHVVTFVVNAGSGLVTWLGFKRDLSDGLVTFAINTVITEAQIWSQPVRAIRDIKRLKKGGSDLPVSFSDTRVKTWYISATPGGAGIRCIF